MKELSEANLAGDELDSSISWEVRLSLMRVRAAAGQQQRDVL